MRRTSERRDDLDEFCRSGADLVPVSRDRLSDLTTASAKSGNSKLPEREVPRASA